MPRITAKYNGKCNACGDPIRKGTPIDYRGAGQVYHADCAPTDDPHADRERLQGMQDAKNWQENRRLFGDEEAERMEIEADLRRPEGW